MTGVGNNGADPLGPLEVTTPENAVLVPLDRGDVADLHDFLLDWGDEFLEMPSWMTRIYQALGEAR